MFDCYRFSFPRFSDYKCNFSSFNMQIEVVKNCVLAKSFMNIFKFYHVNHFTSKKLIKKSVNKMKASLVDMIDRSNYVVFYYAGAYALIFGLFAVAIYYSN